MVILFPTTVFPPFSQVDSERRMAEQQRDIQGKSATISRLQKQLCAVQVEKEEALSSLKQNERKCQAVEANLSKFATKFQRIVDGVAQRDKDEAAMKEHLQSLLEEKSRLTKELERAAGDLHRLRTQIEEAKRENVERMLQLRAEISHRDDAHRELSDELAATREAQLLAVEKASLLEQEHVKNSAALLRVGKEKDTAHAREKEKMITEIKDAEKAVVKLEADLRDAQRRSADDKAAAQREADDLRGRLQEMEKSKTALEAEIRRGQEKTAEMTTRIQTVEAERAQLTEELRQLKDVHGRLMEDNSTLTSQLEKKTADLAVQSAECRLLEENIALNTQELARVNAELARVNAELEATRNDLLTRQDDLNAREEDLKKMGDRVVMLEDEVAQLQAEELKYEAEMEFGQETLRQREAEYAHLSAKFKEIMEEKEASEAEVAELKLALDLEKEAREEEEKAKEATQKEAATLSTELSHAREQIELSKGTLDQIIADKNVSEADRVHLQLSTKSLESKLESSEARCKELQESQARMAEETTHQKAALDRVTAEVEEARQEAQAERQIFEKVIDDLKALHEKARQSVAETEKQLTEAREAVKEQV